MQRSLRMSGWLSSVLVLSGAFTAVAADGVVTLGRVPAQGSVQQVGWLFNRGECNGGCGRFCCHGYANGHGFVKPPAVWGVARSGHMYQTWWGAPASATRGNGFGGAMQYPMVYQPTDTTQMGYYYQTVPRWGYRPDMLPAAPLPNWPLGMHTAYGSGTVSGGGNCPHCQQGMMHSTTPVPEIEISYPASPRQT